MRIVLIICSPFTNGPDAFRSLRGKSALTPINPSSRLGRPAVVRRNCAAVAKRPESGQRDAGRLRAHPIRRCRGREKDASSQVVIAPGEVGNDLGSADDSERAGVRRGDVQPARPAAMEVAIAVDLHAGAPLPLPLTSAPAARARDILPNDRLQGHGQAGRRVARPTKKNGLPSVSYGRPRNPQPVGG